MSWRGVAAVGLLFMAVLGGGLYYWKLYRPADNLELPGVVEIQEVRLGSKIGGRVDEVLVREGDVVEAGQLLVRFAVPEIEAQKVQQEGRLAAMEATLNRVKNGWRPEEVRQAQSDLDSNEADAIKADVDFTRTEKLVQQGTLTQAELDLARANRDRTRGLVAAKRALLEMYEAGSRPEDVALAEANVQEARGRLAEINNNLAEAKVIAPEKSLVEVVSVRKGDLVTPNTPVVRVLRDNDLWVRVYVPETKLGKVTLGQQVKLTMDACPDRIFTGTVFQIASEAEFTPRNVQSVEERRYQVFGVKVRVEDTEGLFKAGMAAQVTFEFDEPRSDGP
ncbi:MAG: efflux RND transporter periplasmic adaptor subunit [Planctomycetaceae bacterium]